MEQHTRLSGLHSVAVVVVAARNDVCILSVIKKGKNKYAAARTSGTFRKLLLLLEGQRG